MVSSPAAASTVNRRLARGLSRAHKIRLLTALVNQAVFSYFGELNEPPTRSCTTGRRLAWHATQPRNICWVELTATGSRPTVPETLFCDDQHQLFLSAFTKMHQKMHPENASGNASRNAHACSWLTRATGFVCAPWHRSASRDGKCATLFQNELCAWSDEDVELSGEFALWDCDIATVFWPEASLSRGWPGAAGSITKAHADQAGMTTAARKSGPRMQHFAKQGGAAASSGRR